MPGKLGVVRPDALADLILIEGNPLLDLSVFSAPASAMPLIMRGGRLIKCSL
jgi:imidazolonepropionase-like amidohydrolase